MTAFLIVQATVPPADRDAFDQWYGQEHLSDARSVFDARSAWRGWSEEDPSVHFAFYEFADVIAAREAITGAGIKGLIAEFDRVWQGRVSRTREVVSVSQTL